MFYVPSECVWLMGHYERKSIFDLATRYHKTISNDTIKTQVFQNPYAKLQSLLQ